MVKVTLRDVAKLAGVSRSAVSRTFTQGSSVSGKMREKVEAAAQELGYSPNALASSLTTGRTKLIGLVLNNFSNPIFLEVFDLFTKALQERGLRPLIVNLTDEQEPEVSLRMLQQYCVDAVILASSTLPPSFVTAFHHAGLPVVHTFGRVQEESDVHVVGIDNVECGRMAARELIRRGYHRVGYIGGPRDATSARDRYEGFSGELSTYSDIEVSCVFSGEYSYESGRSQMLKLLEGDVAQAYFCGDDILSMGAISALRDKGLLSGKDIGIIGLNDIKAAQWETFNLTTIHQPLEQIIISSVDLIEDMLCDPSTPRQTRSFPCKVIERKTLCSVQETR